MKARRSPERPYPPLTPALRRSNTPLPPCGPGNPVFSPRPPRVRAPAAAFPPPPPPPLFRLLVCREPPVAAQALAPPLDRLTLARHPRIKHPIFQVLAIGTFHRVA